MSRLPTPGGDNGNWGAILNDYLQQSHNDNGSIKANVIDTLNLVDDSITADKIADSAVTANALAGSIPQSKITNLQDNLSAKEDLSNKSTNISTDGSSDTKYPSVKSIKTYVDPQIEALADVVTYPTNGWINLFDKSAVTSGGYHDENNNWIPSADWSESDYISCLPNDQFRCYAEGSYNVYDTDHVRISGGNMTGDPWTVPSTSNIKYFKMAIYNGYLDSMYVYKGAYPYPYIAYSSDPPMTTAIMPKSQLYGKKLGVIGDSISSEAFGKPYARLIAEKYGMELYNYAISGSWVSTTGNHDPMCTRYTIMKSDLDYIIIFGGTNDFSNRATLGTIASTDNAEFYGALKTLISGMRGRYPTKKIIYITPYLPRTEDYAVLTTYVQAIKDVCALYAVTVADLFTAGINLSNTGVATPLSDGDLHLNAAGHIYIQPKIEAALLSA